MTSAQVVETSVTNNSSFQNYTHPDDHTIWTTEVRLICTYFWPVCFLFFRVNLTIFDKNDTAPSTLATKPRKIVKYISKLKPFTLYAFQVEAVVLENEGAKSDLVFIQTKESGKLRQGQHFCNLQKKNIPVAYQNVLSAYLFSATMVVPSAIQSYQANWPHLFDILTFWCSNSHKEGN